MKLIEAIEAGDETKILLEAMALSTLYKKSQKDCWGKGSELETGNWVKCVLDVDKLINQPIHLYDDITAEHPSFFKILNDLIGIDKSIKALETDCSNQKDKLLVYLEERASSQDKVIEHFDDIVQEA